jgi:hypothetical protein
MASLVEHGPALRTYAFALAQADRAHADRDREASDVVDRRFVTYAREAKSKMLGIPSHLILAAAALPRLPAWHASVSQRGQRTLSNRQVSPDTKRRPASR